MNECVETIKSTITDECKQSICDSYLLAQRMYNGLQIDELKRSIFYPNNSRQNIFSCCVFDCCNRLTQEVELPISVDSKIVNNFQRKNPIITISRCVLTTKKTERKLKLPTSKFEKKLSEHNGSDNQQLSFNFKKPSICTPPYYGIINYKFNFAINDFEYIHLLIPDNKCSNILFEMPIYTNKTNKNILTTSNYEPQLAELINSVRERLSK